jgi:hypothetical protein
MSNRRLVLFILDRKTMKNKRTKCMTAVRHSVFLLSAGLSSAYAAGPQDGTASSLETINRQIAEQVKRLEGLRRSLDYEEATLNKMRRAVSEELLSRQRGGAGIGGSSDQPLAQVDRQGPSSVGRPPEPNNQVATVAPIFEQPGVLTPKGRYVLEPSLQYGYSSNNRVALVGYTVIPALLVGLIDIREVKRNIVTAALTGRVGITNRFELEARVPYVYRSDSTVSREVGVGTASDNVFNTSGKSIGDVELAARYQFNDGGADRPYFIGSLRFKSRTGKDPFEVVTDCVTRCVGNTSGTGLPLDLPTGSGFYSLQPGLTWLYPSDPAVLFGSFSYLHNFKRTGLSRNIRAGEQEFIGTIEPGNIIGFNVGIGLSLNDRSSFSIGYDHSSVGRTKQNGVTVPGSVRTQLGTLLLGYSHRISNKTSLNVSVGGGLTRDTPDLTLSVRLPMTF